MYKRFIACDLVAEKSNSMMVVPCEGHMVDNMTGWEHVHRKRNRERYPMMRQEPREWGRASLDLL
jgi:hypothetical protein